MARAFDTLIDEELRRRDARGTSPYEIGGPASPVYAPYGNYTRERVKDPAADTFRQRFAPFSSDPMGDFIEQQKLLGPGTPVRPGTRERFLDPTKVISQANTGTATDALPSGFSYRDAAPQAAPTSDLPPGFSYRDEAPPTEAPNVPAPNAGSSRFAGEEAGPVAAPTAGQSQLPEDPAERAAITLKRSASGARTEGPATRAIEGVLPAVGNEINRVGGIAEQALKTGDIAPKDALESAMMLNPASVAYRTGMGVARGALTPAEMAQRETGVLSIPRAADASPMKQAIGRGLSAAPVGGGALKGAAERSTAELQAAGEAAAARPTGEVVDRATAGAATRDALKSTLSEMQAASEGTIKFPPRVRAMLKGTDEDIVSKIATMASQDKRGADIKTLSLIRTGHSAEEWAPMQSALVGQFGRSPATGEFDPKTWLRNYSNLSDAGKNVLFGKGGDTLRTHLDAIEAVSRRAPSWQQFQREKASLGTKVGVAALAGAGTVMAPLTVLGTVIPMSIISRSLARPATAAPIAQWSQAYERVVRTQGAPQAIASFTIATRNLNNTLGTDVSADDILKGGARGQSVE